MEKNDLPSPPLNLKRLSVDTYIGKDVLAGILNLLEISPDLSILEIMDLRSYEVIKTRTYSILVPSFVA